MGWLISILIEHGQQLGWVYHNGILYTWTKTEIVISKTLANPIIFVNTCSYKTSYTKE